MIGRSIARGFVIPAVLAALGCAPGGPEATIICFGDSITAQGGGWSGYVTVANRLLREACPGMRCRLVAAGVSGSRVPDLERRVEAEVLARAPRAVVVYIGINDVWHLQRGGGTPKPDYAVGLRRLVDRIRAAGIRVILCTPSVIGEKPDGANPHDILLDEYADVTREIAAETGCDLVDLRREFQQHLQTHNPDAAATGILTYDGVHLNAAGNRLVAQAVVAQLAHVLPCDASVTDSAP